MCVGKRSDINPKALSSDLVKDVSNALPEGPYAFERDLDGDGRLCGERPCFVVLPILSLPVWEGWIRRGEGDGNIPFSKYAIFFM